MEIYIQSATLCCSAVAIIISVIALYHNKIDAINSFYSNDRDERFIKARKILHTLPDDNYDYKVLMTEHGDDLAYLILSYDQAGVLVKKRQLPFWIFSKGGCGIACIDFYNKLKKYIESKRITNPLYASNYEYLVNKIIKYKQRKAKLSYYYTKFKRINNNEL